LSLFALGGAASAADLPPAPQLPPLEAQPLWTGFYAGLNVGGAFGSSRNAFTIAGFGLPSFSTSLAGAVGGAEAGYNWQTGPWVLGLEANFEGSGLSGSRTAPCLAPRCGALAASYAQKLPWFGTLRPRSVMRWELAPLRDGRRRPRPSWRRRDRGGRLLRRH
jgi:outer membrane immunogenic protein